MNDAEIWTSTINERGPGWRIVVASMAAEAEAAAMQKASYILECRRKFCPVAASAEDQTHLLVLASLVSALRLELDSLKRKVNKK